jgi:hypothetical protein
LIIANMPALIAAGNVDQASITAARSASIRVESGEDAPDFAALDFDDCCK